MKHLDLRYYWLRDAVDKGTLEIEYVPTVEVISHLSDAGHMTRAM